MTVMIILWVVIMTVAGVLVGFIEKFESKDRELENRISDLEDKLRRL